MTAGAVTTPAKDVLQEADRVLASAASGNISARAMGGVAIQLRAGTRLPNHLRRAPKDIDLITVNQHRFGLAALLTELGYRPDREFNALHGHSRLLFFDDHNGRQLDVFVDGFRMCHDLPLVDRMTLEERTLPLAELLLTKLQIVQLNDKDATDLAAMLAVHDVDLADGDRINGGYIARLASRDWGLYRTITINLERINATSRELFADDEQRQIVLDRIARLATLMEEHPKPSRWRLRARIGERVRWYMEPEEVAQ